jgi:hypothetical protein
LPHSVQETAFRNTEPKLLKLDQPLKAEPISATSFSASSKRNAKHLWNVGYNRRYPSLWAA